jgi:hypothetical protein
MAILADPDSTIYAQIEATFGMSALRQHSECLIFDRAVVTIQSCAADGGIVPYAHVTRTNAQRFGKRGRAGFTLEREAQ